MLDKNPIENQSLIPRLDNIKEISEIVSVLYLNVDEKDFFKNLSFYAVAKSFHQIIKQSPILKSSLMELQYPIYKQLITNLDNTYYELSVLNLKKAIYPFNPNMPYYFSNESESFRSTEFLQTIECVHTDFLPGYHFTKNIKGTGDLWYKETLKSDFNCLELKTADLPQLQLYNLLNKIHTKYSHMQNIIICFDVKSSEQKDMIADYLLEHKITNVTSVCINNFKFFENKSYYDTTYGVTNPVDKKIFDLFYNNNFIQNYLTDLKKASVQHNNKVNLLEADNKLDQLVDPKIIDLINRYQEIGNIEELIDHSKYDNFEFNHLDNNTQSYDF